MLRILFTSCIILFLALQPLSAIAVKKEKSLSQSEITFFAVSSLQFHLLNEVHNRKKPEIPFLPFTEKELRSLWKRASLESTCHDTIKEAEFHYKKGRNADSAEEKSTSFRTARAALFAVWTKLNNRLTRNFSETKTTLTEPQYYQNLEENSCIADELRHKVHPYLLPLSHPMKSAIDALFHRSGINYNEETMLKAGFITVSLRPFTYLIVVKHETLPGLILKVYFQSDKRLKREMEGWQWLTQRCEGAQKIKNLINHKKLTHFSVPDKWLYPLPKRHKKCGQPIILVSNDMDLVPQEESHAYWKNASHDVLDELYILLTYGLASPFVSWNIPRSKNGTFTCIDTEHPQRKPNYAIVNQFLSEEMSLYWNRLIQKGEVPKKLGRE